MGSMHQGATERNKAHGGRVPLVFRVLAGLFLLQGAAGSVVWAQGDPAAANVLADIAAPAEGAAPEKALADPPTRVVRLSVVQGEVSTKPASVNTFAPAELNQVLTSGDRVYTDTNAGAELQAGQIAVRMGGGTDLTVTAMTDQLAQFGLAGGSARVRSYAIPTGTVLELDTTEAAVTVLQPGDLRVDEDGASHATTVTVLSGQVQVDGPGISQQMNGGERLRVHAGDPATGQQAYLEPLPAAQSDTLDAFAEARDNLYANDLPASSSYLNPETTGSADLAENGSWDSSDYGPVWFPVVTTEWRPFSDGHWRWVAPWGWTWVGREPWGFAPFHYGRWVFLQGRWGWVPGVPAVRPVYAPALVNFVGGRQFSASLGFSAGTGVAAWFPLGPREPYAPWYHGSTLYLNRVNASNLYNPNVTEVRGFYNQRAVNVFAVGAEGAAGNRTYMNRATGTVAVSQASFAAGQPVLRNQLQIAAGTLAQAPVLAHPTVSPERSMVVSGPARAVPPLATNAHRSWPGAERTPEAERRAGAERASGAEHTASPGELRSGEPVARPGFFHQEAPAVPRLTFEEQRRAMEHGEPGRPLPATAGEVPRLPRSGGAVPASGGLGRPLPAPVPRPGLPVAPPPAPRAVPQPTRGAPLPPSPRK